MVAPPPIQIATLGMWDTLILMVIALVVFGPRKLPQIGRQIGKLMYEFRKASNDFKFQMEEELRNAEQADRRKQEEERLRPLALTAPAATDVVSQVSEARPGAPSDTGPPGAVQSAAAVMESQYPEQTQYPSSAGETSADPAHAEETFPRIQPPSSGEQVPAARPASRAALPADEASGQVSVDTSHDPNPVAETALLPGADELPANEAGLNPSEDPIPDTAQAAHHD
jgi:sec-independent protein translocase protein TatB